MKDLRHSLAEYPPAMLEAIGHGWGRQVRAAEIETENEKAQTVEALASTMLSPHALSEVLVSLSPQEQAALLLVAQRGAIPAHRLTREYGPIQRLGPAGLEREKPWLKPASPAERLWYLGLIYRDYGRVGAYHGEIYFIPPDLLSLLPVAEVAVPGFHLDPVQCSAVTPDEDTALPRDILAVLSYVRRERVPPDKEGYLRKSDLAALQRRLSNTDDAYLSFLQRVIVRARLLRSEDKRLQPSLAARQWLQAKPAERMRKLFEAWRDDRGWNELWQLKDLAFPDASWRPDPRPAREQLLACLRSCEPGKWYTLSDFIQELKRANPDFLRPDGNYDTWYVKDVKTGSYLSGFESWERVEGNLAAYIVASPLRWLGVVRLGKGKDSPTPTFFSLTSLGAWLLGLSAASPQEESGQPFIVRPDLTVLVSRQASLYDRYILERFADWVSEGTQAVYRISERSVWRCLEQGVQIAQIRSFLQRASQAALPEGLSRILERANDRFGRVRLTNALLLQTRDESTMRELLAHPVLRPCLGEMLTPTVCLVDEAKADELVKALKALGYWPRVEKGR